jgi:simple sugar transport system substrate-binding protein
MDNQTPQESEMIAISRRRAFSLAAKLGLGSAALGSGLNTAFAADAPASGGLPKKPYKFFFVCHVTLDQFFTPTIYGIQDACAMLGCQYQWTGSQKNVVSEMVNSVQTAVAEKADGIAVC